MSDFKVYYQGRNVTDKIQQDVQSITFTDNLTANADEIEVSLSNLSGKWYHDQQPQPGDLLTVKLGDMQCGTFEIDAPHFSLYPQALVTLRGLSMKVVKKSPGQKISRQYLKSSFFQVCRDIADTLGVTIDLLCDDFTIEKRTFINTPAINIIKYYCDLLGYDYKLTMRSSYDEDDNLVSTAQKLVITAKNAMGKVQAAPAFKIIRGESFCETLDLEVQSKLWKQKTIQFRDPNTRKMTELRSFDESPLSDVLSARDKITLSGGISASQGKAIVQGSQVQDHIQGTFKMKGIKECVAGAYFELIWDGGISDGLFTVTQAVHSWNSNDGWKVNGTFTDSANYKRNPKKPFSTKEKKSKINPNLYN